MVKCKQPLKTASSLSTDLSLKHQRMCCWSTNRWDFNFEDWIQTSGLKFKNVKSTMLSYQSWLKHKLTQNKLFHIYKQTKNYNNYIFVVVSHNKNKTHLKKNVECVTYQVDWLPESTLSSCPPLPLCHHLCENMELQLIFRAWGCAPAWIQRG